MSDCVWQIGCTYGLRFAKSQPKRIGRIQVFVKNMKIMILSHFGGVFGGVCEGSAALRAQSWDIKKCSK